MNKTIAEVIAELEATGKSTIKGFGTFYTSVKPGREGVSKFGGVEKAWKTEDTVVIKFKQTIDSSKYPVK